MLEEAEGETISNRTWGDICPILLDQPAAADLASKPLGSQHIRGHDPERHAVVQEISSRIHDRFGEYALSRMLPMRESSSDAIPWHALGARATNILRRQGVDSKTELLSYSVRSLYSLHQAGRNTVMEILTSLTDDHVDDLLDEELAPHLRGISTELFPEWFGEAVLEPDEPSQERVTSPQVEAMKLPGDVIDAFADLVAWSVLTGRESQSLLSDFSVESLPSRVGASRDYILLLRADNLPREGAIDAATLLDQLLGQLDERSITALAMRKFAFEPATLEVVGQKLGVTRERARQIIAAAESEIQKMGAEVLEPLRELLEVLLKETGQASTLDVILGRYPALGREVEVVSAPAWRVLVRLFGGADVRDNWFGVPSVEDAAAAAHQAVDHCAGKHGLARIEDVAHLLSVSGAIGTDPVREWLEYVGCSIAGDLVSSRPLGIGEAVWMVLAEAGNALAFEEIVGRLPIERAPSSVRNVLSNDNRFVRVDRDAFGLTEWGGSEYVGIRSLIGQVLEEAGGQVNLEELVQQILRKFSVAEASVRTYAQSHPFTVVNGIVRRRDPSELVPSRRLTSTRRVYRGDREWLLRLLLTDDHARGSGFGMPSPLAAEIGLKRGQSLDLASAIATQSVYWTGLQPAIGSIRRLMEQEGLRPGDWSFVAFGDDGFFRLRDGRIAETLTGLDRAHALVGGSFLPGSDSRKSIAAALGLSDASSWASIVEAARAKGDDDVAEAIMSDATIDLARRDPPDVRVETPDIEEIMRLLK